jgi:hypothetical protein
MPVGPLSDPARQGQKTGSDFKEIDLLGRQFVTFARIGKFSGEEGNEADLNPAQQGRRSEEERPKT